MKLLETRFSSRRIAISIGAVIVLLGAAGCTATPVSSDAGSSAAPTVGTNTPTPAASDDASTAEEDQVTCAAFSDVQTILHNAQSAFYDDRSSQRELDGWSALASRVLGNIPAAEEGRVADALAAVKEAVPVVQAVLGPSNILSREWAVPGAELMAACEAAGFVVMTNAFIGG